MTWKNIIKEETTAQDHYSGAILDLIKDELNTYEYEDLVKYTTKQLSDIEEHLKQALSILVVNHRQPNNNLSVDGPNDPNHRDMGNRYEQSS